MDCQQSQKSTDHSAKPSGLISRAGENSQKKNSDNAPSGERHNGQSHLQDRAPLSCQNSNSDQYNPPGNRHQPRYFQVVVLLFERPNIGFVKIYQQSTGKRIEGATQSGHGCGEDSRNHQSGYSSGEFINNEARKNFVRLGQPLCQRKFLIKSIKHDSDHEK